MFDFEVVVFTLSLVTNVLMEVFLCKMQKGYIFHCRYNLRL